MTNTELKQMSEIKAGLETILAFDVVGVSVVTDNEKGADDINDLWQSFFEKNVGLAVTDKADDNIYAVYSDYEGDHEKPYRLTIGYKVDASYQAPETLHHVHIQAQDYASLSAAGPQPQSLIETWKAVWSSDLNRSYKTDFEFYGPRFFEDGVNEVILYIGMNASH
jgi:predicted transcriptional regulator YdeE